MKYTKPPLAYGDQADLLLSRGMAGDRDLMIERLAVVNYYRLSGYWYPFRDLPNDAFKAGTTFDDVWMRYAFDRRLRLVVMDAVERVEIACRAWLAYHHAHAANDPFTYAMDSAALPGLAADQRQRFLDELAGQTGNSKESFAQHFRTKYGSDHGYMPVWMASEIMTFGHMLTLFRGSSQQVKRDVSLPLGVHDTVVLSWLLALNTIRNICAHHGRLWNRVLGTKPQIPSGKKHPDWHLPVAITNDRIFGILTILKYCLNRVAPQSQWPNRLVQLLDDFPAIPKKSMGIPDDWTKCPIWS